MSLVIPIFLFLYPVIHTQLYNTYYLHSRNGIDAPTPFWVNYCNFTSPCNTIVEDMIDKHSRLIFLNDDDFWTVPAYWNNTFLNVHSLTSINSSVRPILYSCGVYCGDEEVTPNMKGNLLYGCEVDNEKTEIRGMEIRMLRSCVTNLGDNEDVRVTNNFGMLNYIDTKIVGFVFNNGHFLRGSPYKEISGSSFENITSLMLDGPSQFTEQSSGSIWNVTNTKFIGFNNTVFSNCRVCEFRDVWFDDWNLDNEIFSILSPTSNYYECKFRNIRAKSSIIFNDSPSTDDDMVICEEGYTTKLELYDCTFENNVVRNIDYFECAEAQRHFYEHVTIVNNVFDGGVAFDHRHGRNQFRFPIYERNVGRFIDIHTPPATDQINFEVMLNDARFSDNIYETLRVGEGGGFTYIVDCATDQSRFVGGDLLEGVVTVRLTGNLEFQNNQCLEDETSENPLACPQFNVPGTGLQCPQLYDTEFTSWETFLSKLYPIADKRKDWKQRSFELYSCNVANDDLHNFDNLCNKEYIEIDFSVIQAKVILEMVIFSNAFMVCLLMIGVCMLFTKLSSCIFYCWNCVKKRTKKKVSVAPIVIGKDDFVVTEELISHGKDVDDYENKEEKSSDSGNEEVEIDSEKEGVKVIDEENEGGKDLFAEESSSGSENEEEESKGNIYKELRDLQNEFFDKTMKSDSKVAYKQSFLKKMLVEIHSFFIGFLFLLVLFYKVTWQFAMIFVAFLDRIEPPEGYSPENYDQVCGSVIPWDRYMCNKFRDYETLVRIYDNMFYWMIGLTTGIGLLISSCIFLWINRHIFSIFEICIYFVTLKEWLVFRIVMLLSYVTFGIFGLTMWIFRWEYLAKHGERGSFSISECLLFPIMFLGLAFTAISTLTYDGYGSYNIIERIRNLKKSKSSLLKFYRKYSSNNLIKFGIIDALFSDPESLIEEIFVAVVMCKENGVEDLRKFSKLSSYSHMKWKLLDYVKTEKDLIFFNYLFEVTGKQRESLFVKLMFHPPVKLVVNVLDRIFCCRWIGDIQKLFGKMKDRKSENVVDDDEKVEIQNTPAEGTSIYGCLYGFIRRIVKNVVNLCISLVFFAILICREIYFFWLGVSFFVFQGNFWMMADYSSRIYIILIGISVFVVITELLWINIDIVSVFRMYVKYLVLKEWLVFRLLLASFYLALMFLGFLSIFNEFYSVVDDPITEKFTMSWQLGNRSFTEIATLVITAFVNEFVFFNSFYRAITYDGVTSPIHLNEMRKTRKSFGIFSYGEINVTIVDAIFSDPDKVIGDLFIVLAATQSFKDISALRNSREYGHLGFNILDGISNEREYQSLKRVFFSVNNEEKEVNFIDRFMYRSPVTIFQKLFIRLGIFGYILAGCCCLVAVPVLICFFGLIFGVFMFYYQV